MRFLGNFQTLCRSPTVSEKLWCVRFQQSNGFCSCAINMEYPTETLFIWESLSRRSRKNTMVEILWIFYGKTPIFAFRSRFSLDDYQCTNFVRSALTQVASSANLLFVCKICQMKIFFLPSVLDVIYELTMFLNIHFLSWEKWRICRYLLPLLLFFFVEPLVSYKNTDTRSWMEFSFICIVF